MRHALVRAATSAVAVTMGLAVLTTPTANAAVVPPVISSPAVTYAALGSRVAVQGTAGPGVVVALHFHKAGTATADYSIERDLQADGAGHWSHPFTLNPDYRVFATVGVHNPHSATVLFTSATRPVPPSNVGETQTVYANLSTTTLRIRFDQFDPAAAASPLSPPAPGHVLAALMMCVRNVGPSRYDDSAFNDFAVGTTVVPTYRPSFKDVAAGPGLDLSDMAVGDLRCGPIVFEVPAAADIVNVRFTPDSGYAGHTVRWATP